jgi:hypothetical protein
MASREVSFPPPVRSGNFLRALPVRQIGDRAKRCSPQEQARCHATREPLTSANPRATAGIWSRAWKPGWADYLFFFGFFLSFFIDVPLDIESSLRS